MATITLYREGSRGEIVKKIQRVVGCYPDGIWGKLTTEAVKAWQCDHGLTADGIAGVATLTKMGIAVIQQQVGLKKSVRSINEIIVHCSATPEGKDFTVDDIRRWHKAQGWSDIGYHYVVYRNGHINVGRDVNISGAHCTGHNARSIGVCYIGGVTTDGKIPKDTRTDAQKAALLALLAELKTIYPGATIRSHRDFAAKACPSFDATKEYEKI